MFQKFFVFIICSFTTFILGSTYASAYDIAGPHLIQEIDENTIRCTFSSSPDGRGSFDYVVKINLCDFSFQMVDDNQHPIAEYSDGYLTLVEPNLDDCCASESQVDEWVRNLEEQGDNPVIPEDMEAYLDSLIESGKSIVLLDDK